MGIGFGILYEAYIIAYSLALAISVSCLPISSLVRVIIASVRSDAEYLSNEVTAAFGNDCLHVNLFLRGMGVYTVFPLLNAAAFIKFREFAFISLLTFHYILERYCVWGIYLEGSVK